MAEEKLTFGKSKMGTVHILQNGKAKCDKKIVTITSDPKLKIKDVTCSKCRKYKVFQQHLKNPEVSTAEHKPEPVSEPEPVPVPVPDPAPEVKEKPEPKTEEVPLGPQFIIRSINRGMGENICIVHKPTGKFFFEGLHKMVVYDVMKALNGIKDQWLSETDPMPKNFAKRCRKAIRLAYEICDIDIPSGLRKSKDGSRSKIKKQRQKEKKSKRKIKRRPKAKIETAPRKIKRRTKVKPAAFQARKIKRRPKAKNEVVEKEVNEEIISEKKIAKMEKIVRKKIEEGSIFIDMIQSIITMFDVDETTADKMIRQTVTEMTRGQGIPVFIALAKTVEDDFYSL